MIIVSKCDKIDFVANTRQRWITVNSLPRHCGLDPQSPSIVCDKGIPDQVRDDEFTCH